MIKILRKVLTGLLILVVVLAAAGAGLRAYTQHQLGADLVIRTPNGIDEAMFVEAGGIEHWVAIRGENADNPIILFVHGGPAEPHSYFPKSYQPWEKHFTVVQWDQRGTGRTYGRNAKPPADLALAQMTQDGVEIAEWLTRHLGKPKVIVVGHSWGSILGEHMVFARPDLFSAYVGTGQFVSWTSQSEVQYTYSLSRAEAGNDAEKVATLREFGPPPYPDLEQYIAFRSATIDDVGKADLDFISRQRAILVAPRVSFGDIWNALRGAQASLAALAPDLLRADLRELGYDFPIPFFVIQGADDRITPSELARDYFARIRAPEKELVLIEGAGHYAAVTHTDAFLAALVSEVLPSALSAPTQPGPTQN